MRSIPLQASEAMIIKMHKGVFPGAPEGPQSSWAPLEEMCISRA